MACYFTSSTLSALQKAKPQAADSAAANWHNGNQRNRLPTAPSLSLRKETCAD